MKKPTRLTVNEYATGIKGNNKLVLSKAITLVESSLKEDRELTIDLLNQLPTSKNTIRLGITGSPGVGKSTFIVALTNQLINEGKKVAILSIDPSSPESGGSIMGDKTRMESISNEPNVYIRPSPAGNELGGLNQSSREAMLLCEAAGYDVVIIETVGVGQSEIDIKMLCDQFLLLIQPASGDELQGMKKGIVELADLLIVNKADGDLTESAKKSKLQYESALSTLIGHLASKVLSCSSTENTGIKEILLQIYATQETELKNGNLLKNRNQQKVKWFNKTLRRIIFEEFITSNKTMRKLADIEKKLLNSDYDVHNALKEMLS